MKYPIRKEFGIYRHFSSPIHPVILTLAKGILSAAPVLMKSTDSLHIETLNVCSLDGHSIATTLIRPKETSGPVPVLLFLHGGGFVYKGSPHHYSLAKEYALRTGAAVVYVDYRLAFDTPFGTPLDDCMAAYRFVLKHADCWNLDLSRSGFTGDSAGGYLSMALYERCKEEGLALPDCLLLVYPVVDPSMSSASMKRFSDTPMWNSRLNRKIWPIYTDGHPVFTPLEADLSHWPPVYIETAL